MDSSKKRYHLCKKDKYDVNGVLMFKEGIVYESTDNIIYNGGVDDYKFISRYKVPIDKDWVQFYSSKDTFLPHMSYIFTDGKELEEKFNLITFNFNPVSNYGKL